MSFTTSDFKGIVYASDITPSEYILDYINGKGQFYVENSAYPLIKSGKLKPFIDNDFKGQYGTQIHMPMICYNAKGQYTSRFTILWAENKAQTDKTVRVLHAFNGVDESGKPKLTGEQKGKFKKLSIPLTSVEAIKDSPDDRKIALLSFHLNEILIVLNVAYLFGIDLSNSDFKACTNNEEFYETLIGEINGYLQSKKCKSEMKDMESESLEHYNDDLYYRDDMKVRGKDKPKVPHYKEMDGEEVRYVRLTTFHDLFKQLCMDIEDNGGSVTGLVTGAKKEIIDAIYNCPALKNPNTLRAYERKMEKEDEAPETAENFQIKGTFSIQQYEPETIDKLAGLCTQTYNPSTKKWKPIDKEEILMDMYKSRIHGLIYLELSYSFGIFKQMSIGLNTRVAKIDVEKITVVSAGDDEATKLSELRRRSSDAAPVVHDNEISTGDEQSVSE